MRVYAGDNVGIGGFIITGNAPKPVIVRAIGPSLTSYGVIGALPDPVLELHGSGTFSTITNNNWRDSQEAEIQATGLAPVDDLESAIVATLEPGPYTAIVKGNNGVTGIGLVEVYDFDQQADSQLANISTRAFVGTGGEIVIAGFIISSSNQTDRLVIRGLGPSLAAFGITSPLANPSLELHDSNGVLLTANNDWQDDAAQAAELRATNLAPTNSLESAMVMTLPPGPCTALLFGVNSGIGVGIVEVYDLGTIP